MRTLEAMFLGCALVAVVAVNVLADDKKEEKKTLKGTITCSKCDLKLTEDCGNAIKVKEGDKDVIYLFIDEGKKEPYHKEFCTTKGGKKGSVTGVVSEKDGKKYITPSKVEYAKK